ncbi:MAG TPA: glycoside hydrolase family 48 protein [Victivallales bacterium]|nr:glycoside hydrolase family 48 protein [Victivallales bacterium]
MSYFENAFKHFLFSLLFILSGITTIIASDAVEFSVTNTWNSGHQASVKIINSTNTPIDNWTVEFDYPYSIEDIWNAEIISKGNDHYKIQNKSYNAQISPNEFIEFGFVASPGNSDRSPPTNIKLNGNGSDPLEPKIIGDKASTQINKSVIIDILANDENLPSNSTTTITIPPTKGKVVVNQDNTVTYTPNLDMTGNDNFTYQVNNNSKLTGNVSIAITKPVELNVYTQRFKDLWSDIHNSNNGYFSKDGAPYHSVETLIIEAPDYGHETTSEAYSYWIWLEAMYGRVTGDWSPLKNAWNKLETQIIPSNEDQPSNKGYNPDKPAVFAGEYPLPSYYPAQLDSDIPVGKDPVSQELATTYGTWDVYGMHWLLDLDNFYGYGKRGDSSLTPSFMNTFQRGEEESVWETIPHPSWEDFKYGKNDGTGFLSLFVGDKSYSKQWRYTAASDADARVVQAMYRADQWAKEQGIELNDEVNKTSKMGDYLRLAMFDKYFKPIGSQSLSGPGATGYDSAHYLMSWYYAWGGPIGSTDWAFRIGSSHAHFGYQNPFAAWVLSNTENFVPNSPNAKRDWNTSLQRQLEFYRWLQSSEGAIAGGATNSYNGIYDKYPEGIPTFYGMAYVENPVYKDPGSNGWFGMQAWSMQRIAELYYETNNPLAKEIMDKWIVWIKSVVILEDSGGYKIPVNLSWSGQPDTWNPSSPSENNNLHVTVKDYNQDVGITGSLANALIYYAAATEKYDTLDTESKNLAKELLDRMWNFRDEKGISVPEIRNDYKRLFEQQIYIPSEWQGKMANGDVIKEGVSFLDIRSKYKSDPMYPALENAYNDYISGNTEEFESPEFRYHRFWAQVDAALAYAEYGFFFGNDKPAENKPPIANEDTASVNAGESVNIDILSNDSDPDGDVLIIESFTPPSKGTVSKSGNFLKYTANTDAEGSDIFTYTINDGKGKTAMAEVSVTVLNVPKNNHPTAVNDTAELKAGETINIDVLANDSDIDGDAITLTSLSNALKGTAVISTGTIKYTADSESVGYDILTYNIVDSKGAEANAEVSVSIIKKEDPQSEITYEYKIIDSWNGGFIGEFVLTNNNSSSVDSWELKFDMEPNITNIWNAVLDSHTGNHYYIKNESWNKNIPAKGSVSFGFQGSGDSTDIPVNVVINGNGTTPPPPPLNNEPTAANDSAQSEKNQSINIDVLSNDSDIDGDALIISSTSTPKNGSAVINSNLITYTPNTDYVGTDSFSYNISDGNGGTAGATVNVTIKGDDTPVNSNPVANADYVTIFKGENVSVDVLSNDTDSDGDSLSVSAVGTPLNGIAELSGNEVVYTPNTEYIGNESVVYTISDGKGGTAYATLFITVKSNDPLPGKFAYGEALQKSIYFYECQRSGKLPEFDGDLSSSFHNGYMKNRVNWRSHSSLNDGIEADLDLSGGYHDAGDHGKFGFPLAATITNLAWGAIEYKDAYEKSGQLAYILETIKWGTDWMLKAHTSPNEYWGHIGDVSADHSFWGAPELLETIGIARTPYKIDTSKPGSDLAADTAAALAAASIVFKDINPSYSSEMLYHAKQLYSFADNYRGLYHESISEIASFYKSWSGYNDELVWGAAWLYKATGDTSYLNKAEEAMSAFKAPVEFSWDDKWAASTLLMAELTNNSNYKNMIKNFLDLYVKGSSTVTITAGGLRWHSQWSSLRYAANSAFLAFIYSDKFENSGSSYFQFAERQIDYILGDNPAERSYVVGFGKNPPKRVHHRSASGTNRVDSDIDNRNILYGALTGGPQEADDFSYKDDRTNYYCNEVALDYNAAFTGALARMYKEYGGEADSTFPPIESPRTDEYYVEASINYETDNSTEIRALINNRSCAPAKITDKLSLRYFFDLTELYNAGYTVSNAFVRKNWIEGGTLSNIKVWDAIKHIYYVEVDFSGTDIYPGDGTTYRKEAQFRIGLNEGIPASLWIPSNDQSFKNLENGHANIKQTEFIPVYEDQNLISGIQQ